MRLFLTILIVLVVFIAGWAVGYDNAKFYVMRDYVTPLCMMMYSIIGGKEAEDFCNTVTQTERGEEVARLFYIFYKAGHDIENDEDKKACFVHSLQNWETTKKNLDIWIKTNTEKWR